jgi:hypothetical protein
MNNNYKIFEGSTKLKSNSEKHYPRNTMSALTTSHSRVLLLGAGFVVKPTLDILANAGIDITVGM